MNKTASSVLDQEKPTAKYTAEQLQIVSDIFKSIAFPVRLNILDILSREEQMTVGQLISYTNLEGSLLSHHLSKMKQSGVLESFRQGRFIYYKLKLKKITSIFDCIDQCNIFNQ
ncbi:MAG TPA: transcriptional regulator [Phaeodactylibacter sp.]|nr:transcriptional regulator [Phaeodactylibacter sp.]